MDDNSQMIETPDPIKLQKLTPKHKQVLSLLAQGLGRSEIARIVDFTPEYITWLARQQVCQDYLKEMQEFVDQRLYALTEQSVQVIADTLISGGTEEKLKAARLQLEVAGRVGKERAGVNINVQAGLVQILSGIPPESQRRAERVVAEIPQKISQDPDSVRSD